MKKIIVAFDGLKYSTVAQDYAIALAKKNGATLVGVFLEDLMYHSYKIYELIVEDGRGLASKRRKLDHEDLKTRAKAIVSFETACKKNNVTCLVHKDRKAAVRELIKETAYADLLIIDEKENFAHHPSGQPSHFLQQLLPHVECPVLIVPRIFVPLQRSVLLFDGTPASMHAIKMFCYTMPSMASLPAEVFTVSTTESQPKLPDGSLIKEFMESHFRTVNYVQQDGVPANVIVSHVGSKPAGTIIVAGAYQRSAVSRWFKASIADQLIAKTEQPVFIAHSSD